VGLALDLRKAPDSTHFPWRKEYSLAAVNGCWSCLAFGMATAGVRPQKSNWKLHVGGKRGGQRR